MPGAIQNKTGNRFHTLLYIPVKQLHIKALSQTKIQLLTALFLLPLFFALCKNYSMIFSINDPEETFSRSQE